MVKVSVIGLGKVGSALAFCLARDNFDLLLVSRNKEKALGIKMDLIGAFPNQGNKINAGSLEDVFDSDVVVFTAGEAAFPSGGLVEANERLVKETFAKLKLNKKSRLVVITTPVDRMAELAWRISGLDASKVIGFGGQLDLNRLKYLICEDLKDFSKEVNCAFVGEHGKNGIPVFRQVVSDRKKLSDSAKNFYSQFLAPFEAPVFAVGKELSDLVKALSVKKETVLTVSHFDEKTGLFLTWPCRLSEKGVLGTMRVEMNDEEKKDLASLVLKRKSS